MRSGYYVSWADGCSSVSTLLMCVCVCAFTSGCLWEPGGNSESLGEGCVRSVGGKKNQKQSKAVWSAWPCDWHKFAVNRLWPNNLCVSCHGVVKERPTDLRAVWLLWQLPHSWKWGRFFSFFFCPEVKRHQQADVHAAVTVGVNTSSHCCPHSGLLSDKRD